MSSAFRFSIPRFFDLSVLTRYNVELLYNLTDICLILGSVEQRDTRFKLRLTNAQFSAWEVIDATTDDMQ